MGGKGNSSMWRRALFAAFAGFLCLTAAASGPAWTTGRGEWGQLGDGARIFSAYPVGVALPQPALAVAPGSTFALALLADGSVYAWGQNGYGQLGDGATTDHPVPGPVHGLSNITKIQAGYYSAYAVDAPGNLWAWGYNGNGRLGDGTTTNRLEPVRVTALSDIVQVSGGYSHAVALDGSGTVWAWGDNGYGQLGDGTTAQRWSPIAVPGLGPAKAVAANQWATFALLENGTVWAWGFNTYGTLGDGTGTSRSSPVQVVGPADVVAIAQGYESGLALTSAGTVWGWGLWLSGGTPAVISGLPPIASIAAGDRCFFGVEADGTVWGWVNNSLGQLARGTTGISTTPARATALGQASSLSVFYDTVGAIRPEGSLWVWGANDAGQLGDGRSFGAVTAAPASGSKTFTAVSAGFMHAAALAEDGSVWGWGYNNSGQLGTGGGLVPSSEPVRAGTLTDVISLSAGQYHTTAVRSDGTVWWWGGYLMAYAYIPLQVGSITDAVEAASGSNFSLVRKSDGTVWGWGYDTSGQLGDGRISSTATPVQTQGISTAAGVAAGYAHGLAVLQDGSVVSWGSNAKGQLGDGSTTGRTAPGPVVGLPGPAAAVAAGGQVSFARLQDGTLWAWGNNDRGQLGDGTTTERHSPVQVPDMGAEVYLLASSGTHTVALKTDGSVWAWGRNEDGELGDGTKTDRPAPVQITEPQTASAVAAGTGFSGYVADQCAIGCTATVPSAASPGAALSFQGGSGDSTCAGAAVFAWDFGDGSPPGDGPAVQHAYASTGDFGWQMTVSQGGQTCVRRGHVAVEACTLECAADVPERATQGQAVDFSASAAGGLYCGSSAISFDWDFGDGTPHSAVQTPSHAYQAASTYTWTLTVAAAGTACSDSGSITVVDPPVVSSMAKLGSPFRINVTGSNLQNGVRVFINGTEWTTLKWKSTSNLKIKGGSSLKALVPKGGDTEFRFLNPDGGEITQTWKY